MRHAFSLSALLTLLASPLAWAQPPANAAQPTAAPTPQGTREVALWATRSQSDNLARLETGGRGHFDGIGALLNLSRESARIDSGLRTNVEWRRYSSDAIDNETIGTLDGFLDVDLIQNRFRWRVADNYGQGLIDPFSAPGPNNRESVNVFTTGPELDLPLGRRTNLQLGRTTSIRRFDDSTALDNDSNVTDFGVFRQVSTTSRFGLTFAANEVEYDVVGVPAYDIDRTSLRYEREFSSGGVSIALGKNELTFGDTVSDEPLVSFDWSRALATRSSLRVGAAREFSDAAGALRADLSQADLGTESPIVLSTSPFEQQRVFVAYSLMGTRTGLDVSLGTSEEIYVDTPSLDNDNTTARIALQRTVTPRLQIGVDAQHVEREFANALAGAPLDNTDRTTSAWVNRSLGRLFDLAVVLTRYERSGTQAFEENRYQVRFSYSPTGSAPASLSSAGR